MTSRYSREIKFFWKKGSVFDDQYIHVKGSGSAEAPIEISTYGEGDRPQINANGKGVMVSGLRQSSGQYLAQISG